MAWKRMTLKNNRECSCQAHSGVAPALRALESVTSPTSKTDEIHEFCVTLKQIETVLQLKRAKESQDMQY
jgi:hypothetical protein